MTLVPNLPKDAVFEILTRSSLETLGRCRSISKEWNHVTYESTFQRLLCERSNIISGFFIQSLVNSQRLTTFVSLDTAANSASTTLSLDFLKVPVKIEAANQGLLVCVSQNNRYLVCKPSTKQWVKIPNPKTKYFTAATALLVLKSNPLKYKIIRFSQAKELVKRNSEYWCHLRCEIFDSTTWAWKRLKDVILPSSTFFAHKEDSVVAANGGLHWLLSDNQVFAFYENTENWEIFSLPPSTVDNGGLKSKLLLAEYQGRLAVIRSGEEFMDIWVMKNYGRKLWSATRKWNINILNGEEIYVSPLAFHNGEAALMEGFYKVMFYNLKDGKSHQIRLQHPPYSIFKFQSDMEEVNLERPDPVLKLQLKSEEGKLENHPEYIRGLTKYLLPFKGFKPYLFLIAPMFGVLYRCCSGA